VYSCTQLQGQAATRVVGDHLLDVGHGDWLRDDGVEFAGTYHVTVVAAGKVCRHRDNKLSPPLGSALGFELPQSLNGLIIILIIIILIIILIIIILIIIILIIILIIISNNIYSK
jgi:hypothetical protein